MSDYRDIIISKEIRIPYGHPDNPNRDNVIELKHYKWADHWRDAYSIESENGTLQVHVNSKSFELEIVQMNDDGECYRTCLSAQEATDLLMSLQAALKTPPAS